MISYIFSLMFATFIKNVLWTFNYITNLYCFVMLSKVIVEWPRLFASSVSTSQVNLSCLYLYKFDVRHEGACSVMWLFGEGEHKLVISYLFKVCEALSISTLVLSCFGVDKLCGCGYYHAAVSVWSFSCFTLACNVTCHCHPLCLIQSLYTCPDTPWNTPGIWVEFPETHYMSTRLVS